MFKALERNLSRGQDSVNIYEAGHIFVKSSNMKVPSNISLLKKPDSKIISNLKKSIPDQPYLISGLITGTIKKLGSLKNEEVINWRYPIALVDQVLSEHGVEVNIENSDYKPFHPGRCAVFKIGNEVLGYAGEIHPKMIDIYGLKGRVFGYEIYPETVLNQISLKQAPVFSTFPVVKEDLAFIFDKSVIAKDVVSSIKSIDPDLIESVNLFDVYEGSNLEKGQKSLAFSVRLRAQDRTLKTEEVQQVRTEIISRVEKEFQAQLR